MIKKILKYPNPILKRKCAAVKEINDEIKKLAEDMIETLRLAQGVGLAAPQVGVAQRIIIVTFKDGPKVLINPEIIKKAKETEIEEEGCLCLPGLYLKIKRAKAAEIKTLDIDGREIQIKAEGLQARIFQHEIDHLDGISILDRIPFWQRWKIKWRS